MLGIPRRREQVASPVTVYKMGEKNKRHEILRLGSPFALSLALSLLFTEGIYYCGCTINAYSLTINTTVPPHNKHTKHDNKWFRIRTRVLFFLLIFFRLPFLLSLSYFSTQHSSFFSKTSTIVVIVLTNLPAAFQSLPFFLIRRPSSSLSSPFTSSSSSPHPFQRQRGGQGRIR